MLFGTNNISVHSSDPKFSLTYQIVTLFLKAYDVRVTSRLRMRPTWPSKKVTQIVQVIQSTFNPDWQRIYGFPYLKTQPYNSISFKYWTYIYWYEAISTINPFKLPKRELKLLKFYCTTTKLTLHVIGSFWAHWSEWHICTTRVASQPAS